MVKPMEIQRPLYLQQLIDGMDNGLIKVVTGMRRCGKSYLLFTLFYKYLLDQGIPRDHIIEAALDDMTYESLRERHTLYSYVKDRIVDDGKYYILLDEIQYVPDFYEVLNSFLHISNADVYVTGSNSHLLASDVLTELRGRGQEIRLYPLSFAEYCSAVPERPMEAWQDYIIYGGLPMLFNLKTEKAKRNYLLSLFRETYLKDISERYEIQQPDEMAELIEILASAVGSLTNPRKLQRTFRSVKHVSIGDKTISRYISYLKDAFLIDSALRYDIKGKKYINTPVKFYFTDLGLRNALLGFRQIEETHIMENVIFNELKSRGYSVDVGIVERRVQEDGKSRRQQMEIDFIAYEGNHKYYIQSAFAIPDEQKKEQEERPLLLVDDSFKKIVVLSSPIRLRRDTAGITTMSIYDFLLQKDSLDR